MPIYWSSTNHPRVFFGFVTDKESPMHSPASSITPVAFTDELALEIVHHLNLLDALPASVEPHRQWQWRYSNDEDPARAPESRHGIDFWLGEGDSWVGFYLSRGKGYGPEVGRFHACISLHRRDGDYYTNLYDYLRNTDDLPSRSISVAHERGVLPFVKAIHSRLLTPWRPLIAKAHAQHRESVDRAGRVLALTQEMALRTGATFRERDAQDVLRNSHGSLFPRVDRIYKLSVSDSLVTFERVSGGPEFARAIIDVCLKYQGVKGEA